MFDIFKYITVLGEFDSNGLRELFFSFFFYGFVIYIVIPISIIAFLIYCFIDSSKHKIILNNKDNIKSDESNIDVNETDKLL